MTDFAGIDVRASRVRLGLGGVEASRLCLGLGSSGCGGTSMQGKRPPSEVAEFLVAAFEQGVTWWDTSDDYGTHPHVRTALCHVPAERVQITTKSHAADAAALRKSLESSLRAIGRDYVDVFLLHEVDSLDDMVSRSAAAEALVRLRQEGKARMVGLSTHNIDVLERAAEDPRFELILTNFNVAGVHMDADPADYARALRRAAASGQAVAVMKTLGEGVLAAERYDEAVWHNLKLDFAHGVLVGVTSMRQVEKICALWHDFRSHAAESQDGADSARTESYGADSVGAESYKVMEANRCL